jgi:DNA-binding ferritin-like protein
MESTGSDIEGNVEQAAEHFDQFAMQIPGVLGRRIQSVMKHGTKAILMEDSASKAAEEEMVDSLVKGLRHIGDALAADMVRSAEIARG